MDNVRRNQAIAARYDALYESLGRPEEGTINHERFRLMTAYRDSVLKPDSRFDALSAGIVEYVVNSGETDAPVVHELARLREEYLSEDNLLALARVTGMTPDRLEPETSRHPLYTPMEHVALRQAVDAMHDAPEFAAQRARNWQDVAKELAEASPGRAGAPDESAWEKLVRDFGARAPRGTQDRTPDPEPGDDYDR